MCSLHYTPGNTTYQLRAMGNLPNPIVAASVSSLSGSGTAPLSLTPPLVSCEPELRVHKKGKSSVTSVTFTGESYWRSKAPKLVPLEVASQTPSIIKRGFEHMYHKSHGYRLTGGSLYFGPVSSLVRKSQRGVIPTCPDPDGIPSPSAVASISSHPRDKHDHTIAVDVYGDSTKKVLKASPLISLEEAKRREVSRRNRAAKRTPEKGSQIEHEVRRLKREVAEIAWKKAQAKREEEEDLAHPKEERRAKEAVEALEKRKQEEGPTLTAAVAAREDALVVAPTNWIVPLISLDEAQYTERARRDATDKSKLALPLPPSPSPSPPSAVVSVDSLVVNAGNGNTAALQLISLQEAAKRDRARRLEEDAVRSRTRVLAHAGTGLSHVPLITLVEARKQDALRRKNGGLQGGDKTESPNPISRSRMPGHPLPSSPVNRTIGSSDGDRHASLKDASAHEEARWLALMSKAGNW